METYAQYAAKPLLPSIPLAVVLGATYSPEIKKSSVEPRLVPFHSDESEDFTIGDRYVSRHKPKVETDRSHESLERYVAVLSRQKWTSTRDISRSLHISVHSVNHYLSKHDYLVTKKQTVRKGVITNFWCLKSCDNAEAHREAACGRSGGAEC